MDLQHSFELNLAQRMKIRGLELIRKKEQTLEELSASKRISQPTYECLKKKLTEETIKLEAELKSLLDNMTVVAQELESQMGGLELALANLEMHHATGEIDDQTYENQNKAILLSIDAVKQEVKNIKNSLLETVLESVEKEKKVPTLVKAEEAQEPEEEELEAQTEEASVPEEPVESIREEPLENIIPTLVSPSEALSQQPIGQ